MEEQSQPSTSRSGLTNFRARASTWNPDWDRSNAKHYKATCSYDGTDYDGWQTQPHGRSVQDFIEYRLSSFYRVLVKIAGAGRTDAGVHARGQTFNFEAPARLGSTSLSVEQLLKQLQTGLPDSIRIWNLEEVSSKFHSRHSCISKRYVYTICEGFADPFQTRFCWSLGRQRLDVESMARAAQCMVGRHNFFAFSKHEPGDPRTPFKNMGSLQAVRVERDTHGDALSSLRNNEPALVKVVAHCDRFLYRMMRKITGTLVQVGLGKMTPDEFQAILEAAKYSPRVVTAPARGLCLDTVFYGENS